MCVSEHVFASVSMPLCVYMCVCVCMCVCVVSVILCAFMLCALYV